MTVRGGTPAMTTSRRSRPVRLLPSILTILSLCSGMSAVKFGLDADPNIAIALVGAAAVFDTLDGRLARLLDATSKMGAELDSLSDVIAFGVAPALVLYWSLLHEQPFGWIIALVFTVSIVLRLARFNSLMDDDNRPSWAREFFVGVPAPAGALIALLPIVLQQQFGSGWWSSAIAASAWTLFTAALVVSRVPTLAMKSVSVPPQAAAGLLLVVALAAAALVVYPLVLLIVLTALYLAHIPFAIRSQRWVAARPEAWEHKPAERRAQRRAIRRATPRRAIRRVTPRRRSGAQLRLRRPRS